MSNVPLDSRFAQRILFFISSSQIFAKSEYFMDLVLITLGGGS